VLTDVSNVDTSTTVLGQKIDFPLFLSPTAMHQMYHHEGEQATARAAEKFGTFFSYQQWVLKALKKLLIFLGAQRCSNYIFIKIKVSQII
jgi:L-lactate dehydrogenase (FMN-dependent) and related alpha-hydroxy acid dehydrogenases